MASTTGNREMENTINELKALLETMASKQAMFETQLGFIRADQEALDARLTVVEEQDFNYGSVNTGPFAKLISTVRELEQQFHASQENNIRVENSRDYTPISEKLPTDLNLEGLPIFEGTEDPLLHLRAFKAFMAIKGVKADMFINLFGTSLGKYPKAWFYRLNTKRFPTWEDVATEFAKNYSDNTELQTTMRTLEVMAQDPTEGFTKYLQRWRAESVKLVDKPSEKTLVDAFINNLLPSYRVHLRYAGISNFAVLTEMGTRIEDDLRHNEDLGEASTEGYTGHPLESLEAEDY